MLTKAQEAKEQNTVAKERDELGVAFNGAKIGKLGGEVTAEDLNKQFEESKVKAQASGSNPIKIVFEETGNEYEINDEVISGPEKTEEGEQTTPGEEDSKAIKIKVNSGEDGIVALPIELTENCEIDWGDGKKTAKNQNIVVEKIASTNNLKLASAPARNKGYGHIYNDKNKDYIVMISGNVKEITSYVTYENTQEGIKKNCSDNENNIIKEIIQWGETGLINIDLGSLVNLIKVASPTEKSFENLENISLSATGIANIPQDLFKNCPNVIKFSGTFSQCENLKSIPVELFANCQNVTEFKRTFYKCRNLKEIPAGLFANCPNVIKFSETFRNCENLKSIPVELFANCPNVTYFEYVFYWCTSLTNIPANLFANCSNIISFYSAFGSCTSLINIPDNLFANCPNVKIFSHTFGNCDLTGNAIELWKIYPDADGNYCYGNCLQLDNYAEIPEGWK